MRISQWPAHSVQPGAEPPPPRQLFLTGDDAFQAGRDKVVPGGSQCESTQPAPRRLTFLINLPQETRHFTSMLSAVHSRVFLSLLKSYPDKKDTLCLVHRSYTQLTHVYASLE